MQRPLADYSRDEVLMLIDVVVTAYQEHMLVEHERMAAKDRAFLEELARHGKPGSTGVPF
jgi:cell division septum initiation protein DivIVA